MAGSNNPETLAKTHEQKEALKSVKLIIFDLYGTTVNLDGAVRLQAINHGLNYQERLIEEWKKQYRKLMKENTTVANEDQNSWKSLDTLLAKGLNAIMPNLDDSTKQDLLSAWSNPLSWPEVQDALKALKKKGYVLGTMSNASERMQREIAQTIGYEFDHYFSPDQVHAYKPESAIFEQALKVGDGYKENEVLMITNYSGDLTAAASLGFQTAFINRENQTIPADYKLVFSDFTQLVNALT